MANKIANRVKMTVASVASSGTGDITLGSSVSGYLTFAEGGVSNADTVPYVLEAANGDWEIGVGTYTSSGTVLARTTVTKSAIGGVVGTSKITASSTTIVMISPLAADLQSTDTLTSGTLGVARGGTGQNTYTIGDMLYASATGALSVLAAVATGNALISGGVGTAPSWGKVGLTTHVSGTLPVANGGTNASSAGITAFNNITGYTASGATGTTSTNLVFSTSPSITTPTFVTSATGPLYIGGTAASSSLTLQSTSGVGTSDSILFKVGNNGGTTAATIDTVGNLGLGVSPSAWGANYSAIQFKTKAGIANSSLTDSVEILSNAYDSGSGAWKYLETYSASRYVVGAGTHAWYIAPSGSAGSAISFTQAMTLDASGRLAVNASSTSYRLLASDSSANYWNGSSTWTGGNPAAIVIRNTATGGYDPVILGQMTDSGGTSKDAWAIGTVGTGSWTAGNNSSQIADMYFAVRNSTGGISERARIDSSGNFLFGGKTSATANGGDVQVSKGITFPANAVACSDVNTLDDYEEGTFNVTISSTGTAPTGITYSTQIGQYVKVGRQVSFVIWINASWTNSPTGSVILSGLPFTPSQSAYPTLSISYHSGNMTYPASRTWVGGEIQASSNAIYFYANGSGVAGSGLQIGTHWASGTIVEASGFYYAAT